LFSPWVSEYALGQDANSAALASGDTPRKRALASRKSAADRARNRRRNELAVGVLIEAMVGVLVFMEKASLKREKIPFKW
jgi:hypothetical protein